MANGNRIVPDRQKLIAIAHRIKTREILLKDHKDRLWPRFLRTFRPTTTTSPWLQRKAHAIYNDALSKGCHFFVLFAFCISERSCKESLVAEFLGTVEEHDKSYQFKLDPETLIAFRNWELLEVGEVPGFAECTDDLTDPDITSVKRMLSKRGLQGTDSWTTVMSILFPDYPPSTEPQAAFDERQLAHGQGQSITEAAEGATYGGQEAVGIVREQVPNEATGGFPNYPEFTEDQAALPEDISFDAPTFDASKFDAPINRILNFPYGQWPGDENEEYGEPVPPRE